MRNTWLKHLKISVIDIDKPYTTNSCITQNIHLAKVSNDLDRFYENRNKIESVEDGEDTTDVAETWNQMGMIQCYMIKDLPLAIACFEKAISLYKGSLEPIACTLNDLASCYERLDEPLQALQKYKTAVRILEQLEVSQTHPALNFGRRSIKRLQFCS